MRKLTKLQTVVMIAGALLMTTGVFLAVAGIGDGTGVDVVRPFSAVAFVIGAIAFSAMQIVQTYDGNSIVIRRLRRIMVFGSVCFILSGLLMFEQTFRILFPLFAKDIDGYNNYRHYIHNNWGVFLLIACILQLYSTLRISSELRKEK